MRDGVPRSTADTFGRHFVLPTTRAGTGARVCDGHSLQLGGTVARDQRHRGRFACTRRLPCKVSTADLHPLGSALDSSLRATVSWGQGASCWEEPQYDASHALTAPRRMGRGRDLPRGVMDLRGHGGQEAAVALAEAFETAAPHGGDASLLACLRGQGSWMLWWNECLQQ